MIFQSAFDEMQPANEKVDPKALAISLGFTGAGIKMLETGCEIDFHFVDDASIEAGLNDAEEAVTRSAPWPIVGSHRSQVRMFLETLREFQTLLIPDGKAAY
jgi:hypothetical protein